MNIQVVDVTPSHKLTRSARKAVLKRHTAPQRAFLAADTYTGPVGTVLTMRQIAAAFNVSAGYVRAALKVTLPSERAAIWTGHRPLLPQRRAPSLAACWISANDAERIRFVQSIGTHQVRRLIERVA